MTLGQARVTAEFHLQLRQAVDIVMLTACSMLTVTKLMDSRCVFVDITVSLCGKCQVSGLSNLVTNTFPVKGWMSLVSGL